MHELAVPHNMRLVTIRISLFLIRPALREREYRFSAIVALC